MNERNRVWVLLVVMVVLVLANYFVNWSGGDDTSSLFSNTSELDGSYSPKLQRTLNEIKSLPRLSFRFDKPETSADTVPSRNPFIFGVDRQKEAAAKRRLQEMARLRQVVEKAEANPPPEVTAPPARFEGQILGLMKDRETGTVMISVSLDQDYHVVKTGQTISGRYKVLEISDNQVRFLSLKEQEEIKVTLETN